MDFTLFPGLYNCLGFYLLLDLKSQQMCLSTFHIQGWEEIQFSPSVPHYVGDS